MERVRALCKVLDLEFYIGPPRSEVPFEILDTVGLSEGTGISEVVQTIKQRLKRGDETGELLQQAVREFYAISQAETKALHDEIKEQQAVLRKIIPTEATTSLTDPDALAGPGVPAEILEFPASLTPDVLPIPLREEVRGAAGSGAINDNETIMGYLPFRRDWLAKHGLKPKQCSVIEVFGHSMEPTLQNGAMILVDHQRVRRLQSHIFVLWADEGVIVKRLAHDNRHWQLVSDNTHYKPLPWPREATVIGQVMWTGRTL